MAINFPSSPANGDQFTANNIVWTFDGVKWTVGAATSGVYMPIAGGTFTGAITAPGETLTGPLTGTSATFSGNVTVATNLQSNGGIIVNGAAGTDRAVAGATGGSARWYLNLGNATAESGSNAGSDFSVDGIADDGVTQLSIPLLITRANGNALFSGAIQSNVGYQCLAGSGGAVGGNRFNFYWTGSAFQLWLDGVNLGNVTYVSDYRVKENVTPLPSSWDRVKALRPISYTVKGYTPPGSKTKLIAKSAEPQWGFIAHELQETLIPSAATGTKDEENLIQSPNPWTLLATTVKALQEAMERIEALEAA